MLERFRHKVEEMRGLIEDTRSALLAVSGGVDSMCMADLWLKCFGAESFTIAHCNFHLRGEESDGDEALVEKWANDNAVRLHKIDFNTVTYASENGLSIEMAARELRYRWFAQLCLEHGYGAVVVAHHADDNAETLVLNMVRGAGLKGLTGMKPVSPLPYLSRHCEERPTRHCEERSDVAIPLLRPLLTFTRKQIEGYVFANKVPYREDSTNSSVEYRRNSIRHEVFPIFERMNPSYVRTLNREMTYLSDASSIVEEWCKEHVLLAQLSFRPSEARGEISISIPRLMVIPQWRYLLYYMLEPYGFNHSVLASLEELLMSGRTVSGKKFESDAYVLLTERNTLVVLRKSAAPGLSRPAFRSPLSHGDGFMAVPGPGIYHVCGRVFHVELFERTPDLPLRQPSGVLLFDAEKLKFPFSLRRWRQGDWFVPFGMKGKKKVSDLFTDLKYDSFAKSSAVMLSDGRDSLAEYGHIAAVLGVRIDDMYKVTDTTTHLVKVTESIL